MREAKLAGRCLKRKHPRTTQKQAGTIPAPNLLKRDFSAQYPNQKWVVDITYIDTAEGWLYLPPVLDLYGRRLVGWAIADHMETSLIEASLKMAFLQRHPRLDCSIIPIREVSTPVVITWICCTSMIARSA